MMQIPAEVAALVAAAAAPPPTPSAASRAASGGDGGAATTFSIRRHFGLECAVLLTGATGYIGSLVLEKLLRSTDVGHVYVLVRARRGACPADRLARVLRGPLFHPVGGAAAAGRVTAVAGDIMLPGLGISAEDEAMLAAKVDTVLHSAADIRLDAPIHDTLTANYVGSLSVLRLAARMPRLRSFTYISTCYTNINRPHGTLVEERLYPLTLAGRPVDVAGLAEELLAMPPAAAAERAASCIDLWGFRNTYAFGKHLAEKALAAANKELNLPLAIVRPSLVSAVAAEPYPGYCGNFAGPVGSAAAYMTGLYDDQPEAVACDAMSIWDIVPGDVTAAAIIAAAAAVANPQARAAVDAHVAAAPGHAVAGKAKAKPIDSCSSPGGHSGSLRSSGEYADADADSVRDQALAERSEEVPHTLSSAADGGSPAAIRGRRCPQLCEPLIVQVATSCTYPQTCHELFNCTVTWAAAHRRPFTLATGRMRGMAPTMVFDAAECARLKGVAARKVAPLTWLLRRVGGRAGKKMATQLSVGMKSFATLNTKKYDLHLFFGASRLLALEAALAPAERDEFAFVWRPPPADVARVQRLLSEYAIGAGAAASGSGPGSDGGHACWDSDSGGAFTPTGKSLVVGSGGGGKGAAPGTGGKGSGGGGGGSGVDGGARVVDLTAAAIGGLALGSSAPVNGSSASIVSDASLVSSSNASRAPRSSKPLAAALPVAEARAAARAGGWRVFHNNAYAFLYSSLYHKVVVPEAEVPRRRLLRALPHLSSAGRAELEAAQRVEHFFAPVRPSA